SAQDGRGKARRRRGSASKATAPTPEVAEPPRKGLIAALRSAAEALVGRLAPEPPPPPEPPKKRTRRGKRGGRGRSAKKTTTSSTQDVGQGPG
ncbi:MAG: hypothetical protein ACREQ5_33745, partial [Candidatus Dormibacteria bacterium]